MSGATIAVEMGETWVSSTGTDQLMAHGLGACVSLCLYDPVLRLAAMTHIVLPETISPRATFAPTTAPRLFEPLPGKCADTAVPHTVEQIVRHGACRTNLRAAIAGGAQIFAHASSHTGGSSSAVMARLEIGPRNAEAVRTALARLDIPLVAEDVGGHCGRTVTLCVGSGEVLVRRVGSDERRLATLRDPAFLHAQIEEGALCAQV